MHGAASAPCAGFHADLADDSDVEAWRPSAAPSARATAVVFVAVAAAGATELADSDAGAHLSDHLSAIAQRLRLHMPDLVRVDVTPLERLQVRSRS